MTRGMTQTEWDARRAEVKAEAAKTVAANRAEALAALKAVRSGAGYPDEPVRNEVGEVETAGGEEEVKPYGEWTNAELATELEKRDLPHSGNKDELVARLEESDKSEEA